MRYEISHGNRIELFESIYNLSSNWATGRNVCPGRGTANSKEQAGAGLIGFAPFNVAGCWSEAKIPYRPHLPFLVFCKTTGFTDIDYEDRW